MSAEMIAVFIVAFLASLLGPLCGIGGGVIIKPIIDAMGLFSVATISFLSGVTVLTMSVATLAQDAFAHTCTVKGRAVLPLTIGSAVGGVIGKIVFNALASGLPDMHMVGAVQAATLIVLTISVIIYTIGRSKIQPLHVQGDLPSAAIGIVAGAFWSFLGIGGGPFNLAILTFFFAMDSKTAAQGSLFIIAFSQAAGHLYSLARGTVPAFNPWVLLVMCSAAVAGSVIGRKLASRADEKAIDRLYVIALVLVVILCSFNLARFLGVIA